MPDKIRQETSIEYIYRCVEVIRADKNISEDTLVIMFIEYGKKLLKEKLNSR